ncbi:5-carboxymethyl-2-hydroxymuconate Delta-isomerase [Shewanella waksmanii]|uniref:5-carboxymethyl-2-hydroxymuconate Delta-isomerase n=1 Tax=Shewanella waksmanii TaxID=213783 RepID=UPI0037366566
MPHCVVEYDAALQHDVNISQLIKDIHLAVIESGLFEPSAVKTRGYSAEHAFVGEVVDDGFIHIQLTIMPGRTTEQKQSLMQLIYYAIEPSVSHVNSVTMSVSDIDKPHYFKVVNQAG